MVVRALLQQLGPDARPHRVPGPGRSEPAALPRVQDGELRLEPGEREPGLWRHGPSGLSVMVPYDDFEYDNDDFPGNTSLDGKGSGTSA